MNRKIKLSLFIPLFVMAFITSCVKDEVTSIAMSKLTANLNIGQTDSLIATIEVTGNINKFPVTWTSSNPNIVTVSNGKIQGASTGKSTITAKSGNLTTVCEVNITDQIYPTLNAGVLAYYGGEFKTGVSNLFVVGLAGPTDTMYVFINTPISATTSVPVGEYKSLTTINNNSDLVPFTINPGLYQNGIQYNSWYLGNLESPITNGTLKITNLSNNIYTIEVDLVDNYGNNIYGSYVGELNYSDQTTRSNTPSIKNILKSKTSKFNLQLLHFKIKD